VTPLPGISAAKAIAESDIAAIAIASGPFSDLINIASSFGWN
jgi:hypothetical protein